MHTTHFLATAILPAAVLAASIDINVGQNGIVFDPNSVTAAKGDVLNFHFFPPEHSVTQSTFDKPCQPSSGGVFSGLLTQSGENSQVFQVTVNDTNPIWLYCSFPGHCPAGMAMVVNPPSSGNTLAAYQSAAKSATSSSPSNVAGGVFVAASQASGSASSGGSSSATSAGSTASSTAASGGGGGAYGAPAPSSSTSTKSGASNSLELLDFSLALMGFSVITAYFMS